MRLIIGILVGLMGFAGTGYAGSEQEYLDFKQRMAVYEAQVNAEIQRRHEVQIEVLKHQVFLDGQEAAAGDTYIQNNLSSESNAFTRTKNNFRGEIRNNADI